MTHFPTVQEASSVKNNTSDILLATKDSFRDVKEKIVRAMQNLYRVHESKIWESVASSWGEYVESELGISQGFASKLLSVNRHYLVEAGLYPENIEGIDYEKLYAATKLPGSVEEQIAKARTLSRSELRAEKQEADPCLHPKKGLACLDCWSVLDIDDFRRFLSTDPEWQGSSLSISQKLRDFIHGTN